MDQSKQSKKRNKRKDKKVEEELDEDELLDQMIKENQSIAAASTTNDETTSPFLKIDSRQLDPDLEIRNLMEKNMSLCGSRKLVSKQQHNTRTIGRIIKMKTGWPPLKNTGLSLDIHEVKNGVTWFRINHSESYRNQQYLFTSLRQSLDYEGIMEVILGENPYHLESLLLLAQNFIMQEEPNRATDSIERALFAIEAASHKFNLLLPEHQLDYTWRDNRVLFNLLWQQVQVLAGRNCVATALQYAKMLFIKNSVDDPLAVTLLLDTLALKSRNYQFLVDFFEHYGPKRNLDMLPNFLYSTAFAYHCLFEKSGSEQHLTKSRELICKAYTRFPVLLSQILQQLSIDAGPQMNKEAMFQANAFERETLGVQLLVKIYLHHNLTYWKQPERLAWLESTSAEFVLNLTAEIRKEVKVWADKRKNLFVGLPLNIKRHLILCGLSVNDDQVHDAFDPYPPPNTKAAYWPDRHLEQELKQLTRNPQEPENRGQEVVAPTLLNHAWHFFRSIWPSQTTEVPVLWQPEPGRRAEPESSDEEPTDLATNAEEPSFQAAPTAGDQMDNDKLSGLEQFVSQKLQENKEGLTTKQITELTQNITQDERVELINRLLANCAEMLEVEGSNAKIFRYRKTNLPENSTPEEQCVYALIEGAEKSGIWIRDIREQSGLSDAIIRRTLKGLEQKKLIKSIKAVGTAKKSYILYNVDADDQLTGGTFYSDQQFDSQFVQTLVQVCVGMLQSRQKDAVERFPLDPRAQEEYSSVKSEQVAEFIHDKGVCKVQLTINDVENLLRVAVIDGKLEHRRNNTYRALSQPLFVSPLVSMPCYCCPMRSECRPGHRISPENCEYIKNAFDL